MNHSKDKYTSIKRDLLRDILQQSDKWMRACIAGALIGAGREVPDCIKQDLDFFNKLKSQLEGE